MIGEIIGGIGALGSLFGANSAQKAAAEASRAQARLTNMIGDQYAMYQPQVNRMLWQQITNPWNDPTYKTAQRSAEGDAYRYGQQATNNLLQTFKSLGHSNGSSFSRDATIAAAVGNAGNMAGFRVGQVDDMMNRRNQTMSQLSGNASQLMPTAIGSFGQQAQMNYGMAGDMLSGIGPFLTQLAWRNYQSPTPPAGG